MRKKMMVNIIQSFHLQKCDYVISSHSMDYGRQQLNNTSHKLFKQRYKKINKDNFEEVMKRLEEIFGGK